MTIIAISGLDGSGKSTQLGLIEESLQKAGVSVGRCWYRPGYSDLADGLRRGLRRVAPRSIPTPGPSQGRAAFFSSRIVAAAWMGLALVDAFFQFAVRVRLQARGVDVLLCDRYTFDGRLDLEGRFPIVFERIERLWRFVEVIAPVPDGWLLLTVSEGEAERRLAGKDEPFPDAVETRRFRRERYRELERYPGVRVVDAEGGREEVAKQVWEALLSSGVKVGSRKA